MAVFLPLLMRRLDHIVVLWSFDSEVMACGACNKFGPRQAHPTASDASRCPHLVFRCCRRLQVDHPWFRPVVADRYVWGRFLRRRSRHFLFPRRVPCCRRLGHSLFFSRITATDLGAMSNTRRLKAADCALRPLPARDFVCPALVDVQVFCGMDTSV